MSQIILTSDSEYYIRKSLWDVSTANPNGYQEMPTNFEEITTTFNITGSQSSVTLPQTPVTIGFSILVFLNGLKQEGGVAYTIDTTGTIFTFTVPLMNGDVVEMLYWVSN